MVVFPNAKINIGLNLVEKRSDGYHNIESCFYPVPWYDALEVIESETISITVTGINIPKGDNICMQAYKLIKKDFSLPPLNIHLHKNIPIGAGLGGGSADGAFMLKLLNDKFSLEISKTQLLNYANSLGSDCPFFFENKPVYVEGTGDVFARININLAGKYLVIIYPGVQVATSLAFSRITPRTPAYNLKNIIESEEIGGWKNHITNDFEAGAASESMQLKDMLYNGGALYASMSGSGSAVYGIFSQRPDIKIDHPQIISKLLK